MVILQRVGVVGVVARYPLIAPSHHTQYTPSHACSRHTTQPPTPRDPFSLSHTHLSHLPPLSGVLGGLGGLAFLATWMYLTRSTVKVLSAPP